jgi:hypothetical protein
VPWAVANASYKREKHNPGVTEIVQMPNRGHSLTIDNGWREVADTALAFVERFVTPQKTRRHQSEPQGPQTNSPVGGWRPTQPR